MTYFDTTLEADPITEQQKTPVLTEDRFIFELVGFERSQPDEYRKNGGIKWTWRVFHEDGRTPFVFDDEQYLFFRTTDHDKKTRKPLFTVGSSANDWASALLGRTLGADAHFQVPELYGKRMSAMVVWKRQKKDPSKYSVELASLRHVPAAAAPAPVAAPFQVAADASDADIDRAFAISALTRKVEQAERLKTAGAANYRAALDKIGEASVEQIEGILENVKAEVRAAMDD